jgi:hypothetical protein
LDQVHQQQQYNNDMQTLSWPKFRFFTEFGFLNVHKTQCFSTGSIKKYDWFWLAGHNGSPRGWYLTYPRFTLLRVVIYYFISLVFNISKQVLTNANKYLLPSYNMCSSSKHPWYPKMKM